MLGDGLQASLLAIRADLEGFSTTMTGFIMSSFYAGFLVGSISTPKVLAKVGHIRVFAALAALASAAILVHAIFIDLWVWTGLRLVSGFCFAGLYVVAESWLNDRATNESRGKVLSLYMVVTYIGVGIGQLFLNLASPESFELFVLVSILVSVAVLPLLLAAGSPPQFNDAVSIRVRDIFQSSPLGIIGTFLVGMVTATFFALAPVYAQRQGLEIRDISYFMTAAVIGAVLFQWPIGALSDRFDRRKVLTAVTLLASIAAVSNIPLGQLSGYWPYVAIGVFCGLSLPLYSICIAYTNDHLQPEQMIAASGSLVMVGGIGAVSGPLVVAVMMDILGDDSFLWSLGLAHLLLALFSFYRMTRREFITPEHQATVTPTAIHASSAAFESVQQSAQEDVLSEDNAA